MRQGIPNGLLMSVKSHVTQGTTNSAFKDIMESTFTANFYDNIT